MLRLPVPSRFISDQDGNVCNPASLSATPSILLTLWVCCSTACSHLCLLFLSVLALLMTSPLPKPIISWVLFCLPQTLLLRALLGPPELPILAASQPALTLYLFICQRTTSLQESIFFLCLVLPLSSDLMTSAFIR